MKYIFWDFNGTILDDLKLCHDILNEMLEKRNLKTVTRDEYLMIFEFPVIDYYAKVFDLKKEKFSDLAVEFISLYQPQSLNLSLHEHVVSTISYFKEKGVKNILLSASEKNNLIEQINHYQIKHLFDDILGTSDVYATSKKDVFINYLKDQDINIEEIVLIGDTLHDAHLAESVEAKVILYTKGHQHETRLRKYKTIDNFLQLIDIIRV